jgi:phosphate transport system protein
VRHFFTELERLNELLCEMADKVRGSIHSSILCLTERNPAYAEEVEATEPLINELEVRIDSFASTLVARNAPVAVDMRRLIGAIKMTTDLERMGDLALGTSRRAREVLQFPPLDIDGRIVSISRLVEEMVEQTTRAFVSRNSAIARLQLMADNEVDRARNEIYEVLTEAMEKDSQCVRPSLAYMFVARNLERIADHATNIAEDVIFMVEGVDIRHRREPTVESAELSPVHT